MRTRSLTLSGCFALVALTAGCNQRPTQAELDTFIPIEVLTMDSVPQNHAATAPPAALASATGPQSTPSATVASASPGTRSMGTESKSPAPTSGGPIAPGQPLLNFLPTKASLVVGVLPGELLNRRGLDNTIWQVNPLFRVIKRLGLEAEKVEEIIATSEGAGKNSMVALRGKEAMTSADVLKALSSSVADVRKVFGVDCYVVPPAEQKLLVAFPEPATVLLGEQAAIEAALEAVTSQRYNKPLLTIFSQMEVAPVTLKSDGALEKRSIGRDQTPCYVLADADAAVAEWRYGLGSWMSVLLEEQPDLRTLAAAISPAKDRELNVMLSFDNDRDSGRFADLLDARVKELKGQGDGDRNPKDSVGKRVTRLVTLKSALPMFRAIKMGRSFRVELGFEEDSVSLGESVSKVVNADLLQSGILEGPLARLSGTTVDLREKLPANRAWQNEDNHAEGDQYLLEHSWLVGTLPYLGYEEFHAEISRTTSWTEKASHATVSIPEFLNPNVTQTRWRGMRMMNFALTHYVGISGVEKSREETAAMFPRSHPQAGVFGYREIASTKDITDGLATTIMIAGVDQMAGPWIQNGGATIRGVRRQRELKPHFDPLMGFGGGGSRGEGTYVLMADGSSRFVSADIEPALFEAMCTIHGAELGDSKSSKHVFDR